MTTFLLWYWVYHLLALGYTVSISKWRPAWSHKRGWLGLLIVTPVLPALPFVLLLAGLTGGKRAIWSDMKGYYRDLRGLFD